MNGVESATSNHFDCVLPFVAGGGGGGTPPPTSSNPSTALNLNGLGNGTGGWWNLGVGLSSGHVDIDPVALKSYVNSPYYTMSADGTGATKLTTLDRDPGGLIWARDGSGVYFTVAETGTTARR